MTFTEALETLALLPEWEQRYTYLIELAKYLPPMPEAYKTEEYRVRGCTAQVWLAHSWQPASATPSAAAAEPPAAPTLTLHVEADALIVKGLLALIWLAYNGQTAKDVQAQNVSKILENTGFMQHVSPNRRNGFASVEARIHALAAASA